MNTKWYKLTFHGAPDSLNELEDKIKNSMDNLDCDLHLSRDSRIELTISGSDRFAPVELFTELTKDRVDLVAIGYIADYTNGDFRHYFSGKDDDTGQYALHSSSVDCGYMWWDDGREVLLKTQDSEEINSAE